MGIGMLLDRTGIPMTYHVTSATPSADEVSGLVASAKGNFGANASSWLRAALPTREEIAETLADSGDGFVFFRPLGNRRFRPSGMGRRASVTHHTIGSYKVKSRTDEMAGIRVKDTVLWGETTRKSPANKAAPKTRHAIWPSMATYAYHQAKRSSPPAHCFTSIASCGASPSHSSCLNPISRLRPIPWPTPYTCARIFCVLRRILRLASASQRYGMEQKRRPSRRRAFTYGRQPLGRKLVFVQLSKPRDRRDRTGRGRRRGTQAANGRRH